MCDVPVLVLGRVLWPKRELQGPGTTFLVQAKTQAALLPAHPFLRHQKAAPPKIFWDLLSLPTTTFHTHLVKNSKEESSSTDRFPCFHT
jgi:hypothetical protein